ncbi:MAG: MBL fold metallo-hydrolase [Eubacteriales bacterium]
MTIQPYTKHTSYFEGYSLMPLYLKGSECILLDNGLPSDGEVISRTLAEHSLTPIGQICTHAHIDHCANSAEFQRNYHIPIALSQAEAGYVVNVMNYKSMRTSVTPKSVQEEMGSMVFTADAILPPTDGIFDFCGEKFTITHTPGHSAGHVCITTPDGVCYLGDSLMSADMMDSKLPFALDIAEALRSHQKLLTIDAEKFILSHRGTCTRAELPSLVEQNTALFLKRSEEIAAFCETPQEFSALCKKICESYELHMRKVQRVLFFHRNIRFFLEFLEDEGKISPIVEDGIILYQKN